MIARGWLSALIAAPLALALAACTTAQVNEAGAAVASAAAAKGMPLNAVTPASLPGAP